MDSSRRLSHSSPLRRPNSGSETIVESRGRGSGFSTIFLTVPGRAVITTMRSLSSSASSNECVMNRTVASVASRMRLSSSPRISRVCSSSAPNGSSIRMIFGSITSVRAIATRWRMPPESSVG